MPPTDRDSLLASLAAQRAELSECIILTPTDSLPFSIADRGQTAFLNGLYLTDKVRTEAEKTSALVQFAGRDAAARDIQNIYRFLAESFGGAAGSLRMLSGLNAQTAILMSVTRVGQTIALLSEDGGGHYSTHAIAERLGLRAIDLPVDRRRLQIDRSAAVELIERELPDVIFIDRSEGLTFEDFSYIGAMPAPLTIFDASQYVTPILYGRYENPLAWGFDLMLFSTHKSLPGPQKGAVVARELGPLWDDLSKGVSTFISSSHAEDIYLTALTMLRSEWMAEYDSKLLATADALDRELHLRGVKVVNRHVMSRETRPPTHHIWVECVSTASAFAMYQDLAAVGILTNYRKLPYGLGYGLRLGTTYAVVAGLDLTHIEELADIIASTAESGPSRNLRARTLDLATRAREKSIVPAAYWTA